MAPSKLKRPAVAAHVLECYMQVALIDDAEVLHSIEYLLSRLDRISREESGTRHPWLAKPLGPDLALEGTVASECGSA
jgi:hypothetical protein